MLRLAARDAAERYTCVDNAAASCRPNADPVTVVTDPRLRIGHLGDRFLSHRMAVGAGFSDRTAAAATITNRRSGAHPAAGAKAITSRAAASRRPHRLAGHPGEW